jgi:hypothetical protein
MRKGIAPSDEGAWLVLLCALSFILSFVFSPFTRAATLFVTLLLFAAWSSPLLLISLGSLFTGFVRRFLSGLLLTRRILFLLLPTRLLALIGFVCHWITPELDFCERDMR